MLKPLAERQAELESQFPRWEPRTLDQMLDLVAERSPDRPYVVTDDRSYSYLEVKNWSERLASGLAAFGVRPGDHVAVVIANYPEFVALSYAISRCGAVSVPVNYLNRRDELGYVLKQSDATMLITMDKFRDLDYLRALDELAPGWERTGGGKHMSRLKRVVVFPVSGEPMRDDVLSLEELSAVSEKWQPLEARDPQATADIVYTSGTTGGPKGVLLTHDMLLRTAYGSAYGRGFQDARRILFSLPMYHVYGYVEGMLSVLFVGGAIIPQVLFDVVGTLKAIDKHRADDVLLIPTMTLALLDELRENSYDLASLSAVISSGGKAPPEIWQDIFDLMKPEELTAGYGMSETTASTTVTRPDDPIEKLRDTNGRLRDVGVAGDPELGGRIAVYKVVDTETGKELPRGTVGELMVKGPGVTAGYYNKPEATAAAFDEDGWLHTGDLGVLDDDDYITLRGRKKECYRCGGEQVYPLEIEEVLSTHAAVDQAHVVPLAHRRMGEVGVAYVILDKGATAEAQELIDYCSERLARFKVPKHIVFITADELPVTPTGRPRKFLLAERAATEFAEA